MSINVTGEGKICSQLNKKVCKNNKYMCWFDIEYDDFGNKKRLLSFGETAKYILSKYITNNRINFSGKLNRYNGMESIVIEQINA